MQRYSVRCFATAEVIAESEDHARQIMRDLAKKRSDHITITGSRGDKDGSVFAMVTVDERADLDHIGPA